MDMHKNNLLLSRNEDLNPLVSKDRDAPVEVKSF